MPEVQTHEYDVLVIGAGGAGLRAAIEASAQGCRVGVVCKSLLGKAHTVMAEGGAAAAMGATDDRDNWRVHFADTMRGGQYLNNPRMAELHAKEAPEVVRELEAWGALFDRTKDGKILQRNFGGHKYPRLAHVGDRTGLEMIRTLQDHGIHKGIEFHMECTIVRLLNATLAGRETSGEAPSADLPPPSVKGAVIGAFGYFRERGQFVVFKAKAIVLATGGIGKAYSITSNSWEYTGDGHSLAYHAGADLMDMEFVQFHPTGMVWPPSVRGILVTEGVRGEGGVLKNSEGKRFMFEDIPDNYKNQTAKDPEEGWRYVVGDKNANRPPELLTRDHVARCIVREAKEGRGSPHGGVYLDIAWIKEKVPNSAEHIKKKLPSMYHQFITLAGVDITKEPMEVGPTCHYVMGGVRVDPETQMSTVPGLFAAGEVAAGLHGANRLGGNSLSDLLVFGKRAGAGAAAFAKSEHRPDEPPGNGAALDEQIEEAASWALAPFDRGPVLPASPLAGKDDSQGADGMQNAYAILKDLQSMMQANVGIVRREDEMETALAELRRLRQRHERVAVDGNREFNPGWHTALDLDSLLTVSEAVARSALVRKESRGGHFRLDYPGKDEGQGKVNTIVRKGADGEMRVSQEPVPGMTEEQRAIIEEMG